MAITFPRDEDYTHLTDPVVFHARTPRGRVTCKVSVETLREADGDRNREETGRELWNRYRDMVEEAAAEMIVAGKVEPDGSVVVRDEDLEAMRRDSA
jgi:hypothetical protein